MGTNLSAGDHVPEPSLAVDALIIRTLQGVADEADERLLEEWRTASPANERHFRETERVWTLSAGLRPQDEPARPPTVYELVWRARAARRHGSPPRSARPPGWRRRVALTAVIVLGLVGGSYAILRDSADPAADADFEYVASASETLMVTLDDGTIALLAPRSRLRTDGRAVAEVWLDGRAYFAVPSRAQGERFRVRTHAGDAVVLGTRFELDARQNAMRLLVVEGKVEMAARGRTLAVPANHVARLGSAGGPVSEAVDTSYVQRELRWMRGYLVFTETPLDQVARELARYYGVSVDVLDRSLDAQTVHGVFVDETLDDVLGVICRAIEARCKRDADRVTITSGGQP